MRVVGYFIVNNDLKIDEAINRGLDAREKTVDDIISIVKITEDTLYVFYKKEKF